MHSYDLTEHDRDAVLKLVRHELSCTTNEVGRLEWARIIDILENHGTSVFDRVNHDNAAIREHLHGSEFEGHELLDTPAMENVDLAEGFNDDAMYEAFHDCSVSAFDDALVKAGIRPEQRRA